MEHHSNTDSYEITTTATKKNIFYYNNIGNTLKSIK